MDTDDRSFTSVASASQRSSSTVDCEDPFNISPPIQFASSSTRRNSTPKHFQSNRRNVNSKSLRLKPNTSPATRVQSSNRDHVNSGSPRQTSLVQSSNRNSNYQPKQTNARSRYPSSIPLNDSLSSRFSDDGRDSPSYRCRPDSYSGRSTPKYRRSKFRPDDSFGSDRLRRTNGSGKSTPVDRRRKTEYLGWGKGENANKAENYGGKTAAGSPNNTASPNEIASNTSYQTWDVRHKMHK